MDRRLKFTPRQKQLIKQLQKLFDQLYDNNIGYVVGWDIYDDIWKAGVAFYNNEHVDYVEEYHNLLENPDTKPLHITELKHVAFDIDGVLDVTSPIVELENNDYVRNRIRRRYNKMRREEEAAEREMMIWRAEMDALGEPGEELDGVRLEIQVVREVLRSLKEDLEIWESGDNQKIIDITRADILENEKKLADLLERERVLKVEVDRRLEEFNRNFNLD